MTNKIKYKIISFSSEEKDYPVSSLLTAGSEGWQTKRFCNYPQEITLEFYGTVKIDKIQILADCTKIAASVDVLYYNPDQPGNEGKFIKYGTLEFGRNQNGRIQEQKTVMVDLRCLYMRFLFQKPYQSRQNFFTQVHIHQLSLYGGEANMIQPLETNFNKKNSIQMDSQNFTQEQDQFVYGKLIEIQKRKEQAVLNQDFDEAQRLKQILVNVKKFGYKLKSLKNKKSEAADKQDYELARNIKDQVDRLKNQVQILINQTLEQNYDSQNDEKFQLEHDVQGNQFVGLEIDRMLDRGADSRVSIKGSRINNSFINNKKTDRNNNNQSSYDERVIPTLQNKLKTQETINKQQTKKQLQPVQQIDGNNAADAANMMQFFEQLTIRQFFSKNWMNKEKALTDIPIQAAKKPQELPLIKCLIRCVSQSINQSNFKISQLSLTLLMEVLKINGKNLNLGKSSIENRDQQRIIDEIVRKMSDNNAKIRNLSEKVFQQMAKSTLFGVEICCLSLMKPTPGVKVSIKQQCQKLSSLSTIITNFGLGTNGVPNSVVDYGVQKLSNPSNEVRNEAIYLLAVCANHKQELVTEQLLGKKQSYIKQIQQRQKQIVTKKKK